MPPAMRRQENNPAGRSSKESEIQVIKKRRLGFHRSVKANNQLEKDTNEETPALNDDEVKLDADTEQEISHTEEFIFDLSDDDDEDNIHYRNITGDMICEVCDRKFLVVKQFKAHHRRHSSLDHYQCPICLQGFITLTSCYIHEFRVHKNKAGSTDGNPTNDEEDDETSGSRITPSNSLQPYRGPPVKHPGDAFDIEEKYGLRGRCKGEIALQIEQLKNGVSFLS
ncbi:unnamed protein product [Allacma fusca]|uniref:C2H2-type domain-containing protein n=1 Tax=Allacma fusca TaxID=39272 RepID=A0A8J2J9H2_9HEXA|nr:unnamed protein product [Allacma fusca]